MQIFKTNRKRVYSFVAIFALVLTGVLISLFLKIRPNDDILFLDSKSTAILGNRNPAFNVSFGKRDQPDAQWVRFEAKASTKNPFEEEKESFFTQTINLFKPRREYGIEMSLKGVNLSETEKLESTDSSEIVKTVAEIIGTDEISTTTELIESGRIIGEYAEEPISKKSVLNKNVVDGVDIEYQILEGLGLKEEIIIRDLEEYTKECVEEDLTECRLPLNEFLFDLKLDDGLNLRKGWFTLKGVSTETYYFEDEQGNYVAHFLPNWAVDSAGDKTYDVILEVEEVGAGDYRARVIVDINWLFNSERSYPVRIDPSIVHDSKGQFDEGVFDRTESLEGPRIQLRGYSGLEVDSNTVGYWKLDEEMGNEGYILDSSGNDNNGSLVGTRYVNGKLNGARYFSQSEDIISIANTPLLNPANITVGVWVNPIMYGEGNLVSKGGNGGYSLSVNADGTVTFSNTDDLNFIVSQSQISLNEWTYIVATGDDTGISLYINGVLESSNNTPYQALPTESELILGGSNAPSEPFNGFLDEIYISDISYSSEKISRVYQEYLTSSSGEYISPTLDLGLSSNLDSIDWMSSGVHTGDGEIPFSTTGLLAQWNFNENSGVVVSSEGSCGALCNGSLNNFANTSGQDVDVGSGWTYDNRKWGAGALMFDGLDDYVHIPSLPNLDGGNTVHSISAWIKPMSVPIKEQWPLLLGTASAGNQYWKYERIANITYLTMGVLDGGQCYVIPDLYQWNHITTTFDGTQLNCFKNGTLVSSSLAEFNISESSLKLGQAQMSGAYFNGYMDSISIYSRSLSSSEVLSNSQAGNIEFRYRGSSNGNDWGEWEGGEDSVVSMGSDSGIRIKSGDFANSDKQNDGNQYINEQLQTSLDMTDMTKISFQVASDRLGTNSKLIYGNTAYSNYQTDDSTIALWHMDEVLGTDAFIKDSGNSGLDGAPIGTVYTKGRIGGARSFKDDDIITVANDEKLNLVDNLTVEAWINPSNIDDSVEGNRIVEKGEDEQYGLFLTKYNEYGLLFKLYGTEITDHYSNTVPLLNQWSHIAVTYDGSQVRFYLNGSLVSVSQNSGVISEGVGDLRIGGGGFTGAIDEVRISNVVRSPREIRESYEVDGRIHSIKIDFKANLQPSGLISNIDDKTFTISEIPYGTKNEIENISLGDTIIIKKENEGIEYIAQGRLSDLNRDTGSVSVISWNEGSTFPEGGYSTDAAVFKWQQEYIDIRNVLPEQRNQISVLTLSILGVEDMNLWIDDIRFGKYLSSANTDMERLQSKRYLQYKAIFTSYDSNITPQLNRAQIEYTSSSVGPRMEQIMRHGKWFNSEVKQDFWWSSSDK